MQIMQIKWWSHINLIAPYIIMHETLCKFLKRPFMSDSHNIISFMRTEMLLTVYKTHTFVRQKTWISPQPTHMQAWGLVPLPPPPPPPPQKPFPNISNVSLRQKAGKGSRGEASGQLHGKIKGALCHTQQQVCSTGVTWQHVDFVFLGGTQTIWKLWQF